MNNQIDIQHVSEEIIPITDDILTKWVDLTLSKHHDTAELTIRLVTPEEMIHLNHMYRNQNKTTNVLAFPSHIPAHITLDCPFLGDVVICPSVLAQESIELKKPLIAHWAHIVIHGILHLLGFDHIEEKEAFVMQTHEIELLQHLGFENPYPPEEHQVE